jgi:hypothetical protein
MLDGAIHHPMNIDRLHQPGARPRARIPLIIAFCLLLVTPGCDTPEKTIGLTAGLAVGTTLVGSRSPGHEIEQVYYVGMLDPQEQLPPTIYRLTVRGQASALSTVKFASGWVPANLIDTLNSSASFSEDKLHPTFTSDDTTPVKLESGRRMVMFGPEGFRPAPKDHRLVMVMGAKADRFFQAMDEVLGSIGKVSVAEENDQFRQQLLKEMQNVRSEMQSITRIQEDLKALN